MENDGGAMKAARCWLSRHRPKLVQAVRMTAAALATFALAFALDLPQGFWAVITALIVTQGSIGGSLKAALDRFLGSVFGAIYGAVIAFAIPHDSGLSRAAALAIAVAPLSVLAAFSVGFRIAPITAIIVMLGPTSAALGPLGFATDRILEIGLGCAVGLLVSLLVAPARASHTVLDAAAQIAGLLADQLEALAAPGTSEQTQARLSSLGTRTRIGLNKLETLMVEAARERRSHLAAAPDPEPLFRTLFRLRHDLVMLRRAVGETAGEELEHLAQPWAHATQAGAAALMDIAEALRTRRGAVRIGRGAGRGRGRVLAGN
ncbi:MAG: FUSC family protein [Acetobacteraceae bacterium]|nr:FUSC family protein [Acetobacteraceae bacterium]